MARIDSSHIAILGVAIGAALALYGVSVAEGDVWKFGRRALSPVFVPRQIKSFATSMVDVTDKMLATCFPDGGIIDISESFLKLAYGVLSETLFSGEIDGQSDEALRDITRFSSVLGRADPLDILMAPKWLPRLTKLGGRGAINRLRANVLALAIDRRARIETGTDVPDDFLTLLLRTQTDEGERLTDTQIVDEIVTFIGAGHETTSRALTSLSYLLSHVAASRARMEAENQGDTASEAKPGAQGPPKPSPEPDGGIVWDTPSDDQDA